MGGRGLAVGAVRQSPSGDPRCWGLTGVILLYYYANTALEHLIEDLKRRRGVQDFSSASFELPSWPNRGQVSSPTAGNAMRQVNGFNALREQRGMTWIEPEHGWVAAPEAILKALSNEGFEECKHELTTSRRDRQPAGGLWQGVDTRTGSVASAIWVHHPAWQHAVVFIEVDGESLTGGEGGLTGGTGA